MNTVLLSKNTPKYLIISFFILAIGIALPASATLIRSGDRSLSGASDRKVSALGSPTQSSSDFNLDATSENPDVDTSDAGDTSSDSRDSDNSSNNTASAASAPAGTNGPNPSESPASPASAATNTPSAPSAATPNPAAPSPAQPQPSSPAPAQPNPSQSYAYQDSDANVIGGATITVTDPTVSTTDSPKADPTYDPANNLTIRPELGYIPGIGPNPALDSAGDLVSLLP